MEVFDIEAFIDSDLFNIAEDQIDSILTTDDADDNQDWSEEEPAISLQQPDSCVHNEEDDYNSIDFPNKRREQHFLKY